MERIGRPCKLPSKNEYEEAKGKKKISVPLNPQQRTTTPLTKMMKFVSTTKKTTVKTPLSPMSKKPRNNLCWGIKANRRHQIRRRGLTTTMKIMTEPVTRTTTATATAEVTGIPAP